jgi:hypothetical protein
LETAQVEETLVTFVAMPLIMIIALYLLACAISPLINLNNQTFRIIFTATNGAPTLFLYQKSKSNKTKRTPTKQKRT